jgi:hypothetical protein
MAPGAFFFSFNLLFSLLHFLGEPRAFTFCALFAYLYFAFHFHFPSGSFAEGTFISLHLFGAFLVFLPQKGGLVL